MSFFIPPSIKPDPDWALVPGNHTNFRHVSLLGPNSEAMQTNFRNPPAKVARQHIGSCEKG